MTDKKIKCCVCDKEIYRRHLQDTEWECLNIKNEFRYVCREDAKLIAEMVVSEY